MSNLSRPTRAHFTPEAFRELAEAAVEELYANADVLELHDLRTWRKKLTSALGNLAEYQDSGCGYERGASGDE